MNDGLAGGVCHGEEAKDAEGNVGVLPEVGSSNASVVKEGLCTEEKVSIGQWGGIHLVVC